MSQCPVIVDEYLQYVKDTIYDFAHILAALHSKDTNQDIDHGQMTVVIRYKTPYIVQGHGFFILSFTLRHAISLRGILGLNTL